MAAFKIELGKQKQDGTAKVMIRVVHERQSRRIDTNLFVTKNDLTRSGKIKNQELLDILDDRISELRRKSNKLAARMGAFGFDSVGIDTMMDYLLGEEKKSLDFVEVFREFIEENADKKGLRNYKSALNSFVRFLGRDKLDMQELTAIMLQKYAASLGSGRALSLYLGALRHVHNWAMGKYNNEELGIILIPYSPFAKFKVPKQGATRKRALEASIIRRVSELPYKDENRGRGKLCLFDLAKDCFVLSFCLIGMNSADLYGAESIKDGMITYCRAKTRDRRADRAEISVRVQGFVRPLFEKYADPQGGRVFMFHRFYSSAAVFNRALNMGLKQVGEALGVEDLEFYAARHSWATIARNEVGIDKFTVHEALNHVDRDMAVTDIYIKKDFSAINEANRRVLEHVFG